MCHSVMLYVYCLFVLHFILLLLFHLPLLSVHILTCFPASHSVAPLPFPIFHLVIFLVFCFFFLLGTTTLVDYILITNFCAPIIICS